MSSNLRAKPIEGHVTDSAGNILRNAQIKIKQATPSGSYTVDTAYSDDSGFFTTKPIQDGLYDIYESGILITRTIHSSDKNSIQSFKAHSDNYNILTLGNFDDLATAETLNEYRAFLQIEAAEVDITQYGSSFPIYDVDITTNPNTSSGFDELWNLSDFYALSRDSRITTTRFDVEYYMPITSLSTNYQRIRWTGVPAIRYSPDSKLVLPLDYYSIMLNHPRIISPSDADFNDSGDPTYVGVTVAANKITLLNTAAYSEYTDAMKASKVGDIMKVYIDAGSLVWYGIVTNIDETSTDIYSVTLEKWKSSRFDTTVVGTPSGLYATRILVYDGMFRGILDINEEANERFSVVENIYAQGNEAELYNYNDH